MSAIKGEIKLKVTVNRGAIAKKIVREHLYDIFVDLLFDLADDLQRGSYVGASKAFGKPSLKEGWDIIAPRKSSVGFDISASVVNRTPAALNRVVGRGSGKFPPVAPIREWVQEVIGEKDPQKIKRIAFLVGRKIAQEGTDRFRSKSNYAGLNVDGTAKSGSIFKEYERIIKEVLEGL